VCVCVCMCTLGRPGASSALPPHSGVTTAGACCVSPCAQKECSVRDDLKLDYDAYSRDVRSLVEKGNPNMAKLAKKEAKLAEAEAKLEAYSEQLFGKIRVMLLERDTRLLPQLRQVCCSADVVPASSDGAID
jgi:hypothetical protein